MTRAPFLLLAPLALAACAPTEPNLTPTQWEAIEARTFDTPAPRTFVLVAQTMLDQGYVVLVSDSAAGVIRGARQAPPGYRPEPVTAAFGELWPGEVVAYVRDDGTGRARVRIQVRQNGIRIADEDRVRMWSAEIQKRALGAGQPLARPDVQRGDK